MKDEDCGGHGKCWDIEATSAPRKQCYCEKGFFGAGCSKKSPIRSKSVQLGIYTKKQVSEKLTIYWRILKEDNEIEMVLKLNGTSYAAVGWRPKGLTASCKKFPVLADQEPVARSLDLKNYPKSKSEGSDAEPEAEPESEPEAEPESEPEAESEPAVAAQIQPREGRSQSVKTKRMSTRTDVGISFVMSSVSSSRKKREAARHGRAFAIPLNDREENTSSPQGENFVYKFYQFDTKNMEEFCCMLSKVKWKISFAFPSCIPHAHPTTNFMSVVCSSRIKRDAVFCSVALLLIPDRVHLPR